jgi:hypothetical protein
VFIRVHPWSRPDRNSCAFLCLFAGTVADVLSLTGTTYTAAKNLVSSLTELGILVEATGYKRNRVFRYQPYIDLFGENPSQPAEHTP